MLLRRPDLACSCLLRKRLCCYISFSIYSNYKSYMWCTWFVFIVCLIVLHAWSCFIGFISQPLNCYRTCKEHFVVPSVQVFAPNQCHINLERIWNRSVNCKLTVICLKHFATPCEARPMLEGSQSRHEDVILLNQCHCNDAGLRVMVHSLVHPVLNVALQFHLVSLFAWCGKKCEPQSFKIASHRRNDPIFASGIEAWPGRLGREASRFRKSSKQVESGRQICFYITCFYHLSKKMHLIWWQKGRCWVCILFKGVQEVLVPGWQDEKHPHAQSTVTTP